MNQYRVAPDGLVHIQAVAEHGHWTACFDGRPEVSFGGNTVLTAAKRLVRSAEDLDESTLRIVYRSDDGRVAGLTVCRSRGGASAPSAEERAGTSGWRAWRTVMRAAEPEGADGVHYRIELMREWLALHEPAQRWDGLN